MAVFMRRIRQHSRLVGQEHKLFSMSIRSTYEYGDVAQTNLRDEAMSVSAEVPQYDGDSRPVTHQQRTTTRADRLEAQRRAMVHPPKHIDRQGMRMTTAMAMLTCTAFLLMFLYIMDTAQVTDKQKEVDALRTALARREESVQLLEQEYDTAVAGQNVAYEAKQHGLISSKRITPTELYVPAAAVINPADGMMTLPGDALATILGD